MRVWHLEEIKDTAAMVLDTVRPGWSSAANTAPVIVVGMHRSGTTLLTRVLEAVGVFWGSQRDEYNEDLGFQAVNEQIFRRAGATWDRPQALADRSSDPAFTRDAADWVKEELPGLEEAFFRVSKPGSCDPCIKASKHCNWGWKDPRNTFTLPVMLRIFPFAKVVHICRNGIDVAASLWKRETTRPEGRRHPHFSDLCQELEGCFSLWKTYIEQAETIAHITSNFHELKFEDLVTDTENEVRRLLSCLDMAVPSGYPEMLPEIIRERADASRNVKSEVILGFAERVSGDPVLARLGYT